jgi:hypothetical protein
MAALVPLAEARIAGDEEQPRLVRTFLQIPATTWLAPGRAATHAEGKMAK